MPLDANRYYAGVFFFNVPPHLSEFGKGGDVCFWFSRDEQGTWFNDYRHRHYADERIFDNQDEFHWKHLQGMVGDEEEVLAKMKLLTSIMAGLAGTTAEFFPIGGHIDLLRQKLLAGEGPRWLNAQIIETAEGVSE